MQLGTFYVLVLVISLYSLHPFTHLIQGDTLTPRHAQPSTRSTLGTLTPRNAYPSKRSPLDTLNPRYAHPSKRLPLDTLTP